MIPPTGRNLFTSKTIVGGCEGVRERESLKTGVDTRDISHYFLFSFISNKKLVFILLSFTVLMTYSNGSIFHFFFLVLVPNPYRPLQMSVSLVFFSLLFLRSVQLLFPLPYVLLCGMPLFNLHFVFSFSLFFFNTPTHLHTRTYITLFLFYFFSNVVFLFLASLLRSLCSFLSPVFPFATCKHQKYYKSKHKQNKQKNKNKTYT